MALTALKRQAAMMTQQANALGVQAAGLQAFPSAQAPVRVRVFFWVFFL